MADRGDAKAALKSAAALRTGAAVIEALPSDLAAAARDLHDQVRAGVAYEQLRAIPVERLRETAKGLRLDAIEQAGITDLARLLDVGEAGLVRLPNVGPETAGKAVAAARQVHLASLGSTKVTFDITTRPQEQTQLLDLVRRYDGARRLLAASESVLGWAAALPALIQAAQPAGKGWARRALMGRKKRDEADARANTLATTLAEPEAAALEQAVDQATAIRAAQPTADEVWQDYQANAAGLLGVLAEISGGPGAAATTSGHGELTEDVVERVLAQELDQRFLVAGLRGYQAFGAKFALAQKRTILGDEMGLGKTIEAIAVMCHLRATGLGAALVVCPASVVANWRNEIDKHSDLEPIVIHGSGRDAAQQQWEQHGGVAITTYDHLKRLAIPAPMAGEHGVLLPILVVDEAHYVKNPRSQRAKAVHHWAQQAERVLFLSGTPMENRVDEFRNLVNMLQPDLARTLSAESGIAGASAFRTSVAPAYLRRNQVDVLDELPDRIDSLDWVDSTDEDDAAYRDAVATGNFMAMRRAAFLAAGPPSAALTRADVERSAKLDRLLDIIEEAHEAELKVIVFSFFRDVLAVATSAARIINPTGVYGPISGDVPPEERQQLVDALTAHVGPAVLTAQIEAGGTGLNIQAASVVILCEPQWKPTIEAQAIARAHRMGQVRRVQVHRLLVPESVDEHMLRILAGKSELFAEYVTKSSLKDLTPEAIDATDIESPTLPSQAEAERQILEAERKRIGLEPVAGVPVAEPETAPVAEPPASP